MPGLIQSSDSLQLALASFRAKKVAARAIGFALFNSKLLTDPDLASAQVTDAVTLSRCRTQTTISTVHLDTDRTNDCHYGLPKKPLRQEILLVKEVRSYERERVVWSVGRESGTRSTRSRSWLQLTPLRGRVHSPRGEGTPPTFSASLVFSAAPRGSARAQVPAMAWEPLVSPAPV